MTHLKDEDTGDENDAPKRRGRPPKVEAPVERTEGEVRKLRIKLLRGYVPAHGMDGFPIPEDWPDDMPLPRKLIAGQTVELPIKEARELLRIERAVRADPLPGDDD